MTDGFDLQQLISKQAGREEKSFESNRRWSWGITVGVDYEDDPSVKGMPGFIYVLEHATRITGRGGLVKVYNSGIPPRVGVMVLIARDPNDPNRRTVIGQDTSVTVFTDWWDEGHAGQQGPHHQTHEWPDGAPGTDVVHVYRRAIVPLRTYPGTQTGIYAGVQVSVTPMYYDYYGELKYYAGDTDYDISSHIPTNNFTLTYVLIYLDAETNTLQDVANSYEGTPIVGDVSPGANIADHIPHFPSIPDGAFPSAIVLLQQGDTTVVESDIIDVRSLWNVYIDPHPIVTSNATILTIDSDFSITATSDHHQVSGGGIYTVLSTITAAEDYQLLLLQAAPGESITVEHSAGGIYDGNIFLNSEADVVLSGDKSLLLFYDGTNWSDVAQAGASIEHIVDTKANILASSPADPTVAFATDNGRVYFWDGAAWYETPLAWTANPAAPDMGAEQDSSRQGYGPDYISDKRLSHVLIGSNDREEEGAIRTSSGALQIYLAGAWNNVVLGFRFREDANGAYELEHRPLGFDYWYEVMSGNSDKNGIDGRPIVQQYNTSMGAEQPPLVVDGGSF